MNAVMRAVQPDIGLGEPFRDVRRGVTDRDRPRRVGAIARHDLIALLPAPPRRLQRSAPLATPPADSGLEPVRGDPGWPLLGWSLTVLYRGPLPFYSQRRERYGRLSWSRLFGRRVLTVASADAIETVLRNADGHWSNRDGWDWLIGPFFDGGLMLLDDPQHRRDRRIMNAAFTRRRVQGYQARLAQITARQIDHWPPGPMRAYPALKQLTLDVATDVFLDEEFAHDGGRGEAEEVNEAFIACVRAGTALLRRGGVPGSRWQRGLEGRARLETYFRDRVPAHRREDGDDLLSALCHARSEEGESFSDADVVNHIIFLMMAAHDTATIITNAIVYFLMAHPEWQERCRAESSALADQPSVEDMGELASLDLVLRETLRAIPPVPGFGRMAVADTALDGCYIPAGTAALLAPLAVHHDPQLWRRPHVFDPERFSPERREHKVHPFAYIPFGGGAHRCIGMHFGTMEVKTIVHQLLRRFRMVQPQAAPSRWDWSSLPKPLDDLPVRLEPLG